MKRTGKRQFVQLYRNIKRSIAYHGLSCEGRAALIELIDRYNGINNGFIGLGSRELAYELNCSQTTAVRVFRELDDAGLAHPTKVGAWRGKKASEWRLTFRRCDNTGELPINNWPQRKPYAANRMGSAKEPSREHRDGLRTVWGAQKPKNPINGSGLRTAHGSHVHISRLDTVQARARRRAGLDPPAAAPAPTASPQSNGRCVKE
jgi:hypothetical protein